ncbi:MAG: glycosyltransferase family 39 protein [Chloroflexota bacterium]
MTVSNPTSRNTLSEILLLLGLFVAALGTRYPYLWVVPRFRDETFNALRSLQIYRGELFPLTDVELYMGSFFNYAVTAGFYVSGPSIYTARLVVTLFGAATVVATYLLGRQVGGRVVGLIAAGLMVTNGIHIAAMGHVGFSANIAPFFSTVGFWLLHRAATLRSGRSLAGAGFAFGMALHTHPITVGYLPGAALWVLATGRHLLKSKALIAAALLFLFAYLPMIAYNVQTAGGSVAHALYTASERPDYARNRPTALTPRVYLDRMGDYGWMIYQTAGGSLDGRGGLALPAWDPTLLLVNVLCAAGVLWAALRGYSLALIVAATFSVILPIFNAAHYDVVGDGRYFALALPLVYASLGMLVRDVTVGIVSRGWAPRAFAVGAASLIVAVIILAPISSLVRYYGRTAGAEPTNASLIRAMDRLVASREQGQTVILDENLNDRRVANASPWDEASTFRIFRFIMEFEAIPYRVIDLDETSLARLAADGRPYIVILGSGRDSVETANLGRLLQQFNMQGLDGATGRPPRPADRYGMYRLDPAQALPAGNPRA